MGNDRIQGKWEWHTPISIHVPSWGTTHRQHRQLTHLLFQSTFPRGERHFLCRWSSWHDIFQSTFPRGERRIWRAILIRRIQFQSTFPRGERLMVSAFMTAPFYFNPRSLVGNDGPGSLWQVLHRVISIHVPSWGTTFSDAKLPQRQLFQSTFPRGERPIAKQFVIDSGDFNPRSLVGNDGKFSQIFFVFLCNKYNFSTFYYPFSLFFSVIHVTFLIFVVRILPAFYVYFWFAPT